MFFFSYIVFNNKIQPVNNFRHYPIFYVINELIRGGQQVELFFIYRDNFFPWHKFVFVAL